MADVFPVGLDSEITQAHFFRYLPGGQALLHPLENFNLPLGQPEPGLERIFGQRWGFAIGFHHPLPHHHPPQQRQQTVGGDGFSNVAIHQQRIEAGDFALLGVHAQHDDLGRIR